MPSQSPTRTSPSARSGDDSVGASRLIQRTRPVRATNATTSPLGWDVRTPQSGESRNVSYTSPPPTAGDAQEQRWDAKLHVGFPVLGSIA